MSAIKITAIHRGVVFIVGPRAPFPGIGWKIETYDHLGRPMGSIESCGAFYDDDDAHPEGAYAWASAACKQYINRLTAADAAEES